METILFANFACILLLSRDRNLHLENLALRQQLAILKHKNKLGGFIRVLERLEKCSCCCETGNSDPLAQKRIQAVLGV